MAGYSQTPLSKKLGIAGEKNVLLVSAPAGFERALAPLPAGVRFVRGARGRFDVAVAFFDRVAKLRGRLAGLKARMQPNAGLWIAWPKKTSGVATDLTEDLIRDLGLAAGLVDNKVCAIDETWSGLRLVIRVADRPKAVKRKTAPKRAKKRGR